MKHMERKRLKYFSECPYVMFSISTLMSGPSPAQHPLLTPSILTLFCECDVCSSRMEADVSATPFQPKYLYSLQACWPASRKQGCLGWCIAHYAVLTWCEVVKNFKVDQTYPTSLNWQKWMVWVFRSESVLCFLFKLYFRQLSARPCGLMVVGTCHLVLVLYPKKNVANDFPLCLIFTTQHVPANKVHGTFYVE